jgi:raffinose/stachyose/melibiose transport system permease protein
MSIRKAAPLHGRTWLTYGLLTIFLLIAVMPFFGIFMLAFKDISEVGNGPFALPEAWNFDNFVEAWQGARFGDYFTNSIIVVVPTVAIAVVLALMAGYAFGTMRFRGETVLLLLILLGLMVPFEAVIIPLWQLLGVLNLRDTYWALILPQVALSFAFGTFWMRAHFKGLPEDLIDAAVVDGCGSWGVLWRVLLPLSTPALLSLIVLLFMWTWNEFLLVLVMASGDLWTMPVGLALLRGRYASDPTLMAAGATMMSLPVIIIYVIFQRQFIRGLVGGALKG